MRGNVSAIEVIEYGSNEEDGLGHVIGVVDVEVSGQFRGKFRPNGFVSLRPGGGGETPDSAWINLHLAINIAANDVVWPRYCRILRK